MKFPFPVLSLIGAALLLCPPAHAAPTSAPGLGFDVTARIMATGKSHFPPQIVRAHVTLSGAKARVETNGGAGRSVVLYAPPFVYRLLPDAKAGVKWSMAKVHGSDFGGFDPQQLLRSPAQLRASLLQSGAKRTGVGVLDGVPVEIFDASRPGQRFAQVRAWLRRSDSLPVRLEATNGGLRVVASWSHYAKLASVAASQFAPPKGFSIRESPNPPILPLL